MRWVSWSNIKSNSLYYAGEKLLIERVSGARGKICKLIQSRQVSESFKFGEYASFHSGRLDQWSLVS